MEFSHFLSKISIIKNILLDKSYNGLEFQNKMIPEERLNFDMESIKFPKEAAVLAFFYPKNNKTYLLLTLRADYNGTHAAQISFPGGKKDTKDVSLKHTALRESHEEVGIEENMISEIHQLSKLYIPPSNFWVFPFIGISETTPIFTKNYEVAEIIEVDLDDLLNNNNLGSKTMTTSYAKNMNVPCFILNNHIVWGATAMILSEIKEILKLANIKV